MAKMEGVKDPLATLGAKKPATIKDDMEEALKKAAEELKKMEIPEAMNERLYYQTRFNKRAKRGKAQTKAMTFEIAKDMAEALAELVRDKRKKDKGFNKSIALRKGLALYLSLEGYGKRRNRKKNGTGKDSSTKKSN